MRLATRRHRSVTLLRRCHRRYYYRVLTAICVGATTNMGIQWSMVTGDSAMVTLMPSNPTLIYEFGLRQSEPRWTMVATCSVAQLSKTRARQQQSPRINKIAATHCLIRLCILKQGSHPPSPVTLAECFPR